MIPLEGILSLLNVSYECANNGQQALEIVKKRIEAIKRGEAVEQFKLIFLDYSMPIMDGPTFAKGLRKYIDEQTHELNGSIDSLDENFKAIL